jgi:hypothetical protein
VWQKKNSKNEAREKKTQGKESKINGRILLVHFSINERLIGVKEIKK